VKIVFAIIFLLLSSCLSAQDIKTIEAQLKESFLKIDFKNEKSLVKSNEDFEKLLLKFTSSNPETMSYDFKDLTSCGLTIATSEDSMFRIYSWDTRSGGTMHFFENVFQFKSGQNIISRKFLQNKDEDHPDPGCFYYQINDIIVGNRKFYIAQSQSILSTSLFAYRIQFFSVKGSRLFDDNRMIKTRSGFRNDLKYEVDLTNTLYSEDNEINSGYSIIYDKQTKTIMLPVVLEGGKINGKKIIYQFNGEYFNKL